MIDLNGRLIGDGQPCYVIAEIGINHNGSRSLLARMIESAADCGCDAVKFQKRTVDVVYSKEELDRPRETPFGTTNRALKRGLELSLDTYDFIDSLCQSLGIQWFASCWDCGAVDDIAQYNVPTFKVASASLTDIELIEHTAAYGKPLILSTGMSTMSQIESALVACGKCDIALLHCVSTYPSKNDDLNLRCIRLLSDQFGRVVGYSGHEQGLATSVAAVALGAKIIERHFTLDRTLFGSDQAASIEPAGMARLVRDIRAVEEAMGDGVKRVLPDEEVIAKKLRRVLV